MSLRLIFAYPALVVSNAGALFTVQMLAILLKLNLKFFSEAFRMPAVNSMTEVSSGDVMPRCAIYHPSECIRRLKRFP